MKTINYNQLLVIIKFIFPKAIKATILHKNLINNNKPSMFEFSFKSADIRLELLDFDFILFRPLPLLPQFFNAFHIRYKLCRFDTSTSTASEILR